MTPSNKSTLRIEYPPWKMLLSVRKCLQYWGLPWLSVPQELIMEACWSAGSSGGAGVYTGYKRGRKRIISHGVWSIFIHVQSFKECSIQMAQHIITVAPRAVSSTQQPSVILARNFVSQHWANAIGSHPQASVAEATEHADTHMILTRHLRSRPLMGAH